MAYFPIESILGLKGFANIDTATALPIGFIARGVDTALGGGEFVYLPGVTGTVAGSLVVYNPAAQTTTLAPNTANLGQPVAVAMAANATTKNFGWYQISGVASIKKTATTVSPNVRIFLSGTAGRIMATIGTGKEILDARSVNAATVASATSTVNVLLNRSFTQGQII